MTIEPRTRFEMKRTLDEDAIAIFAANSGDWNPLHHDRAFAERSRYGGIIASGPQTTALLMGLVATYFSALGTMVGLDFSFRFRAAAPANDQLSFEWMIIRNRPTKSLDGDLVELRGRVRTSTRKTAVGAKGLIVVSRSGHAIGSTGRGKD